MSTTSQPAIYLDHAATTPMAEAVREAMLPYLGELYGNPSSLHRIGKRAAKAIDAARQAMADCLGIRPTELIFTSGATEADNLAILGLARALAGQGRHLVTTAIEHPAVQEPCRYLEQQGWDVTWLPVDAEGFVSVEDVRSALRPDTVLVSIIHGNNEVGTIQPIEAIGEMLRTKGVLFHIDAVQTVGKLPMNFGYLPVDYASMSAHKLYGPKGVGALYVRDGVPVPEPLLMGGGQEGNVRSGTENVAGIVGFAKALQLATERAPSESLRLRELQKTFIQQAEAALPHAILNGPRDVKRRVPGNVHFSFPPYQGEALVLKLDLKGIAVSSGSACHSEALVPSRIVLALGKSEELARATLRFSMGVGTTRQDLEKTIQALSGMLVPMSTLKR